MRKARMSKNEKHLEIKYASVWVITSTNRSRHKKILGKISAFGIQEHNK